MMFPEAVYVSVVSPKDMAMSAFLNRLADLGGSFICLQQILTQTKSAILSGNGKPQAEILNVITIFILQNVIEKVTGCPYNEFELIESTDFFKDDGKVKKP